MNLNHFYIPSKNLRDTFLITLLALIYNSTWTMPLEANDYEYPVAIDLKEFKIDPTMLF